MKTRIKKQIKNIIYQLSDILSKSFVWYIIFSILTSIGFNLSLSSDRTITDIGVTFADLLKHLIGQ